MFAVCNLEDKLHACEVDLKRQTDLVEQLHSDNQLKKVFN